MDSGLLNTAQGAGSVARWRSPASAREFSPSILIDRLRQAPNSGRYDREFQALALETNPELFFADLMVLGDRQLRDRQDEAAARTFSVVRECMSADFPGRPRDHEAIAARAEHALVSFETVMRRFARQATDPIAIAGMGAASFASSTVRAASLARLLSSSRASFATVGWGARVVSGIAAFTAENLAFVSAHRLLSRAAGRPVGENALSELASSAFLIGSLRIGGAVSQSVARRFLPSAPNLQFAFHQLGTLGALRLANGLEIAAGLRPASASASWTESLATLLQFHVAGRLTQGALGREWESRELDLNARAEGLAKAARQARRGSPPWWPGFAPQLSVTEISAKLPASEVSLAPHVVLMSMAGEGKGGKPPVLENAIGARETIDQADHNGEATADPVVRHHGNPVFPALKPKQRLGPNNRYQIVRRHAEGGNGIIYQARDIPSGRLVALKVPSPKVAHTPEYLERIEKEVWVGENINSPWAVTVHTDFEMRFGSESDATVVKIPVMEFIDGANLGGLVADVDLNRNDIDRVFPLDRRIAFFADLVAGVHDAHLHGLTNNDLKPDNVYRDRLGRARIVDWGLARFVGEPVRIGRPRIPPEALLAKPGRQTEPGDHSGTPGYMAPEIGTKRVDEFPLGQDIFSLGSILWELVTGKNPFTKFIPSSQDTGPRLLPDRILAKVRDAQGVEHSDLVPNIDNEACMLLFPGRRYTLPTFRQVWEGEYSQLLDELQTIASRAMEWDPALRFRSAAELREAVLMAEPRATFRELAVLKLKIQNDYDALNEQWKSQRDGVELPPFAWEALHGPVEDLRQRHRLWEQGALRLLNRLHGITGGDANAFPEAHRMIAEINWQLLSEQYDFLSEPARRDYVEQINRHDRSTTAHGDFLSLSRSVSEAVPLSLQVHDAQTRRDLASKVEVEVIPWIQDTLPDGRTGTYYRPDTPIFSGKLRTIAADLRLPVGYYALQIRAPGYAEVGVPLVVRLGNVRDVLERKTPGIVRSIPLLAQSQVRDGFRLIPPGDATLGMNIFYGHENLVTTYSFPARNAAMGLMALMRDPVTVGQYVEMVADVLRREGAEEAEKLIPRVMRSNSAWRRDSGPRDPGVRAWLSRFFSGLRAAFQGARRNLLPAGSVSSGSSYQLYWKLQGNTLVDPTTHLDPNDDPIYLDQPISSISYVQAEAYRKWASERDGTDYFIPEIWELEAVAKSFLPFNFTYGNTFNPIFQVSRAVFADKTLCFPQRVGTHPLGETYDRDFTMFGTRGHIGNVREFSSTPGERNTVAVFGGSIGVVPGPFYYPASRNFWIVDVPNAGAGAFRLAYRPLERK